MAVERNRNRSVRLVPLSEDLLATLEAPLGYEEEQEQKCASGLRGITWCKELWDELLTPDERRAVEFFNSGCEPERAQEVLGTSAYEAAMRVATVVAITRAVLAKPPKARLALFTQWLAQSAGRLRNGTRIRGLERWGRSAEDAISLALTRFFIPPRFGATVTAGLRALLSGAELTKIEVERLSKAMLITRGMLGSEASRALFMVSRERVRNLLGVTDGSVRAAYSELFGRVRS